MNVSFCVTSVLMVAIAFCGLSSGDATIGSPVSDSVAVGLNGGCGYSTPQSSFCDDAPCSADAYLAGAGDNGWKPAGNSSGTYCTKRLNGENVCKTCSDDLTECSG